MIQTEPTETNPLKQLDQQLDFVRTTTYQIHKIYVIILTNWNKNSNNWNHFYFFRLIFLNLTRKCCRLEGIIYIILNDNLNHGQHHTYFIGSAPESNTKSLQKIHSSNCNPLYRSIFAWLRVIYKWHQSNWYYYHYTLVTYAELELLISRRWLPRLIVWILIMIRIKI